MANLVAPSATAPNELRLRVVRASHLHAPGGKMIGLKKHKADAVVQLAVPDNLVPVILGTKGTTLRDLMNYSGAAIKVGSWRLLIHSYS